MHDQYAKRKAPWGTGPFYRVNILGGLFGLTTLSSVNRSMGFRPQPQRVSRGCRCGIPPDGNPFGPPDIDETQPFVARSSSGRQQDSNAAGRHVAINVITSAQKDDAVTRRIGLVVFQFVVRHDDLGSDIDVFTTQRYVGSGVRDDRDIFVTIDFERIRPISIRFATT